LEGFSERLAPGVLKDEAWFQGIGPGQAMQGLIAHSEPLAAWPRISRLGQVAIYFHHNSINFLQEYWEGY
jgi:hypothetical protein